MSAKIFGGLLLLFVVQSICYALIPLRNPLDLGLLNSAYYDPNTGNRLKGMLETSVKNPLGQITFRGLSCQCEKLVCNCCVGLNPTLLKINQQACTTLTFMPKDSAIKTALSLNNKELVSTTMSGKNPPPLCVSPFNLQILNFCVRIFDISVSGKNLHACLDVETRVTNAPVLVLHFNCMQIGANGLSWGSTESASLANVVQTTESSQTEEYDEVSFEPEDHESTTTNSNSTSSEDDDEQVGQLKL